ncbi:hypothetical protein DBR40_25090 [Pedobacter sp. KBW01]|uniref:O-antigen ligase family protein n=1 Tax=Pedobacter sp. KBW01 TaxID=2153364 RepID=UPI000F5B39E6|nr:O-antigen ligase family protein [Pedobacter sp. KBW01]RQO64788.1 hypothetical protein DBR40_25090 [Pedobacter sp. KBW01]
MINLWFFRIAITVLFCNSLIAVDFFPRSLFSANELALEIGSAICLILAGLKMCRLKSANFGFALIDLPVLGFLIFLSLFAFSSAQGNTQKILNQFCLGVVYVSVRILCQDLNKYMLIKSVITIFLGLCLCSLMIAGAQFFSLIDSKHSSFEITGLFFNPAPFAILMAMSFVFFLIISLSNSFKNFSKYLYIVLICLVLSVLIFCMSRSAWVGALCGLIIATLYYIKINKICVSFKAKAITSLFLIFLCPCLGYGLYCIKETSATGRLFTWKVAYLMLEKNWQYGVGLGKYPSKHIYYQAVFFNQSELNIQKYGNIAGDIRYCFNDILQIFCETGIFGLSIFVLIIVFLGIQVFKRLNQQVGLYAMFNHSVLATIFVVLISGLSSYPLSMMPLAILFWSFLAIFVSFNSDEYSSIGFKTFSLKPMMPVISMIIGIVVLFTGLTRLKAYHKWDSLSSGPNNHFAFQSLLNLYSVLSTDPNYLNDLATYYIREKQYTKAIPHLRHATEFSPYKGFYFSLGGCYEQLGRFDEARRYYLLISRSLPNLLEPKVLLAKTYYKQKDYTQFRRYVSLITSFKPKIDSEEVRQMKEEIVILQNSLNNRR